MIGVVIAVVIFVVVVGSLIWCGCKSEAPRQSDSENYDEEATTVVTEQRSNNFYSQAGQSSPPRPGQRAPVPTYHVPEVNQPAFADTTSRTQHSRLITDIPFPAGSGGHNSYRPGDEVQIRSGILNPWENGIVFSSFTSRSALSSGLVEYVVVDVGGRPFVRDHRAIRADDANLRHRSRAPRQPQPAPRQPRRQDNAAPAPAHIVAPATKGHMIIRQSWPDSAIWVNIAMANLDMDRLSQDSNTLKLSDQQRWSLFYVDLPPVGTMELNDLELKLKYADGKVRGTGEGGIDISGHYNDTRCRMALRIRYSNGINVRVQCQASNPQVDADWLDVLYTGRYRIVNTNKGKTKPLYEGRIQLFAITDGLESAIQTLPRNRRRRTSSVQSGDDVFANEDAECLVCMDAEIDCCLKPCGHIAVCYKCVEKLDEKNCPVCRKEIKNCIMIE